MFEKLLSALPFNPSVVQQLAFYAKRMKAEQSVRRIGLIFIILAFMVQFFAFISPPQSTSASSPNDLITGGFSSAAEAASDCTSNVQDYQTILANYGITCAQVASANTLTINSDDWGKQLFSMGRLPESIPGESTVTIPGLSYPLYARYLWGWDSPGTSSNYQVLNVTTTGGQTFLLMYACGNLVSVGFPQPVQQPPNISISKTTIPGSPEANSTVSPGTTLGYRIYFNDAGGAASNVVVNDPEPTNTTFSSLSQSTASSAGFSNGSATWNFSSMPSGASNWYVDLYYTVNSNAANGTQICNTANISSAQSSALSSNPICMTVQVNAPPPPPTPKPPTPPCEQQLSTENSSACITTEKAATNVTENIADANGTTAQAGDLIKYTLSATNIGSAKDKDYVFSDSLAYVLDYSTLTDAGGGTLQSDNELVWPATTIDPGKTATQTFEVTVDNPIPQTPTSSSDPNLFNLKMTNQFSNTITINLPPTPTHTIQAATTALPNTGPGTSIMIGAVVLAVAGFFFYRTRLLSKEAKIAITEQSGGE